MQRPYVSHLMNVDAKHEPDRKGPAEERPIVAHGQRHARDGFEFAKAEDEELRFTQSQEQERLEFPGGGSDRRKRPEFFDPRWLIMRIGTGYTGRCYGIRDLLTGGTTESTRRQCFTTRGTELWTNGQWDSSRLFKGL